MRTPTEATFEPDRELEAGRAGCDRDEHARRALGALVGAPGYPCLGARSVFHRERARVKTFGALGAASTAPPLLEALNAFSRDSARERGFASFLACFSGPAFCDEAGFEDALWRQLQQVHDVDPCPWSPEVSEDPAHPGFAFSAGGTAFFVVGLHPRASRRARRAPAATLVFNLHSQFAALRRDGKYERLRDAIRVRDARLQGSINPMVGDHGGASAARQYSGRAVEAGWAAPFELRGGVASAGRERCPGGTCPA